MEPPAFVRRIRPTASCLLEAVAFGMATALASRSKRIFERYNNYPPEGPFEVPFRDSVP